MSQQSNNTNPSAQFGASEKFSAMDTCRKVFDSREDGSIKVGQTFTPVAEKKLAQHEHLFLEGEKQGHIFQILDGVVGVYKMLPDGRRHITKFYYPGDLIGLEEQGQFHSHGEALSDSRVRCIPVNTIDSLIINEPGFGRALLSLVTNDLKDAREQLLALGRKSAIEKVATFFYEIHKKGQYAESGTSQDTLHLPMTRSEIADYLGLTIETVSRCITRLKTSKVIKPESRTLFTVLDAEKLESFANDSSVAEVKTEKKRMKKAA